MAFSSSSMSFPETEPQSMNQNATGKIKILVSDLPPGTTEEKIIRYFGEIGVECYYIHFESNNSATLGFNDEDAANTILSKRPLRMENNLLRVDKDGDDDEHARTICVHDVPNNMDLKDLQLFIQDGIASGEELIIGNAKRNIRTNLVEITFSSENIAKRAVEKSPLTYNDCNLPITFKSPFNTESLPQSDKTTIIVHGIPESVDELQVNLYFRNRRRSRGGKIKKMTFDRKNGTKITFASSIDAQNVIEKNDHEIKKTRLTVEMYKPPIMEEKLILISNLKPEINGEILTDFMEVKAEYDVEKVRKIKTGVWLVHFGEEIDFEKLESVCKSDHDLDSLCETSLEIRQVPVSNEIIVSDVPHDWEPLAVKNYFKNPSEPDEMVSCEELPNRRMIIRFKTTNLAYLMSKSDPEEFDVNIYYDIIDGYEIYQEIVLPSPFLVKFMKDHKESFEVHLQDCGKPAWNESIGNSLMMKCNHDIEEKKLIEKIQSTVNEEKLDIPSIIFEEMKEEILAVKEEDIEVYFDDENCVAHIFSRSKDKATDYKKKMSDIVKSKSKHREEIDMEAHKMFILFADFFPEIHKKYEKLTIKPEGTKLIFDGFSSEITEVTNRMNRFLDDVSSCPVQLSQNAHCILDKKPVKEYIQKKLKEKKYICAWEINSEKEVFIHSSQKNHLGPAMDILKESIEVLTFPLKGSMEKIIEGTNGKQFLKHLSFKYADRYFMDEEKGNISIVTLKAVGEEIGDAFEKFFSSHITYEKTWSLSSGNYVYLKTFRKDKIDGFCQRHPSCNIRLKDDQTLHFSFLREDHKEITDFLQSLIKSIKEEKEVFYLFSFEKFLQTDAADKMLKNVSSTHKCTILKNEDMNMDKTLGGTSTGCQVEYKSCTIKVQSGDITELDVDAIVNTANKKLKILGGLGKAIVQKGGPEIQDECDKYISDGSVNELLDGDAVVTTAGNLKCKAIIHSIGPAWKNGGKKETESLSKAVKNSLGKAKENDWNSIALSAISTGLLGFPVDKATDVIVSRIKEYVDNNTNSCLKQIYLVDKRPEVITAFQGQLKSMFPGLTTPLGKKDASKNVLGSEDQKPTPASLFFYADSFNAIENAKREIEARYRSEYFSSKTIENNIIKKLQAKEREIINQLQFEFGVEIEFKTSKICVSGYKEDVSIVTENIQTLLNCLKSKLADATAAELTEKLVQWRYMDTLNGQPTSVKYSRDINYKLEKAYENREVLKVQIDSQDIVFDLSNLDNMLEYPENNKKYAIMIDRQDLIGKDPCLQLMDNNDDQKHELIVVEEYDRIKDAFPPNFQIIKIEEVRNQSLCMQYQNQQKKMDLINPKETKNETQGLWHYASEDAYEKIYQTGFRRDYCRKNAIVFGRGVYFAKNPLYFLNNISQQNADGFKYIYMCKVLTGISCQGNPNMAVLPENPTVKGMQYDTAVDDLNNPTIFVTFHYANAYPQYLITFK